MAYYRSYVCSCGCRTESDFGNSTDFEKVQNMGMLACASCNSTDVQVEIASPRVSRGGSASQQEEPNNIRGMFGRSNDDLMAMDVGPYFAEAARALIDQPAEERPNIVGLVSDKEVKELVRDEIFDLRPSPLRKLDA
jgi:hypothetical protein